MADGLNLFLSIEGVDGTGKSSLVGALQKYLEAREYPVVVTREPGNSLGGQTIRGMLFSEDKPGPGTKRMFDGQVDCLMLYDHIGHAEGVIRPALEAGKWVITDRYADSQFAYSCVRNNVKAINEVYAYYFGPIPDVTFLLIGDVQIFARRAKSRDSSTDALEPGKQSQKAWAGIEMQKRIQEAYIHNLSNQPRTIMLDITDMDKEAVANAAVDRLNSWVMGHRHVPEQTKLFLVK